MTGTSFTSLCIRELQYGNIQYTNIVVKMESHVLLLNVAIVGGRLRPPKQNFVAHIIAAPGSNDLQLFRK